MKTIFSISLFLILIIIPTGCEQNKPSSVCGNNCENETVLAELEKVPAKIIKICLGVDDNGNSINCIYVISINRTNLDKETRSINKDNILVPCNGIPEKFQKENLKVSISGLKKSCCKILTKPYVWGGFGCKFEITSIEFAGD